jgi:NAD(P)-dependent dehydrogenase (short-subunit alcohol dehydrogenase family)
MTTLQLPITPSFRLDGKRALVTGGSRGIGLAMAAALASAGAAVTIVARKSDELMRACNAIRAAGGTCDTAVLDVTDLAAVKSFAQSAPVFDVLVNNAGVTRNTLLKDMVDENFDTVMDLNVRSVFVLTRELVARMQTDNAASGSVKPRSIINISSQMGLVGGVNRTLYCASKHALEGFSKALAWELASSGIRVNTLCPTFIDTEFTRPYLANPEFKQFVTSRIARGTLGQIEEVMGPVIFLASDASSLMTGSALVIDGGWTAQ